MDFTQAESTILNHIALWDSLQYLKDAMKTIHEAQCRLEQVSQDTAVLTQEIAGLSATRDSLKQDIDTKTEALLAEQATVLDAARAAYGDQEAALLARINEGQVRVAQLEQAECTITESFHARSKELSELNNRIAIGEKFLGVVLSKRDALAKSLQEVQ